jgi:hypothetical protein
MTVALWTICHHTPRYELYDNEVEAAAQAVTIQERELAAVMGVQYDDGRTVRREDWPAYRAERERRVTEEIARAAAAAAPSRWSPLRAIKDPFNGCAMHIDASEPTWLGR